MLCSFRQVEAISFRPPSLFQRGFTLIELIMVMVIVGILAVFVVPRFFDADIFRSRGFADQVQASLRYAQKIAIAQRRFVCATFTVDSVTLTTGPTAACGTDLQSPTGEASYVINAPVNTAFAAVPAAFNFDALGRPSAGQVINVTGATNAITIEAETGYVH
jgi:MSHA pilin protein MshC